MEARSPRSPLWKICRRGLRVVGIGPWQRGDCLDLILALCIKIKYPWNRLLFLALSQLFRAGSHFSRRLLQPSDIIACETKRRLAAYRVGLLVLFQIRVKLHLGSASKGPSYSVPKIAPLRRRHEGMPLNWGLGCHAFRNGKTV